MSETAEKPRRKVSREGVVLLKSFEGFRARAERDGDGWVIGYGHRRSAREGLTVGEADAELLLQYDLLPVVAALNALPAELNGHQFDALASFVFSVGVERFLASDVHARLAEGRTAEAADALLAWPETAPPTGAPRRRAAERALFLSAPDAPVTLADLLSAPLPTPRAEPVSARAAAVAALLGDEAPTSEPPADALEVPVEAPAAGAATIESEPPPGPDLAPPQPPAEAEIGPAPGPEPAEPAGPPVAEVESSTAPEPSPTQETGAEASPPPPLSLHRQSPYAVAVVGPLPGFGRPTPAVAETPSPVPAPLPPAEPPIAPEPAPEVEPEPRAPVVPNFGVQAASPLSIEPLVLTPPPDVEPSPARPVWDEAERPAPTAEQTPLFVEAPPAVSILRHEAEPEQPRRFDWSETGMYVIMGGLGLVSCAVSAAAFRLAVEDPSPMGETAVVAWALAGIGAVCVGAASWHLWAKTRRRG